MLIVDHHPVKKVWTWYQISLDEKDVNFELGRKRRSGREKSTSRSLHKRFRTLRRAFIL